MKARGNVGSIHSRNEKACGAPDRVCRGTALPAGPRPRLPTEKAGRRSFVATVLLRSAMALFAIHVSHRNEAVPHRHHWSRNHGPERKFAGRVPPSPAGRSRGNRTHRGAVHGFPARGRLPFRSAEAPEEEGGAGGHAGGQHRHLLRPGGGGGQRPEVGGGAEGPRGDLPRLHRARQRRDGERNPQPLAVRLRHEILVALPQPPHGREQPGRRDLAEPRGDGALVHDRRRLRGGQHGADSRDADAAARRGRPGDLRRGQREHPHLRDLRRVQIAERAGHARGSEKGVAAVRPCAQRHRDQRGRRACSRSSGWRMPRRGARTFTARSRAIT